jgi:glycosyltransferase involved in cell wall biosynthesis
MKILILGSKEYPLGTSDDPIKSGGIEVYTQNLVKHLKEKVERIIIVTRRFRGTKIYEMQENIEIHRVPWIRGFYLRNPSFNLFAFLKALFLDFDVILAQGPVASFLGALLSIIKRKKIVACPAGIAYVQPQYRKIVKRLLFIFEKITYRCVDAVIFLSEVEKEQFKKKLGYLPKHHFIIPPGIEILKVSKKEVEKIKKELGINKYTTLTFVGRLIGVKGVKVFIHAMKDLNRDFKAVIVGDGPDRKKLENLVKEYNLENRVIFTGWRDDVPAILAASDIFVLPSYSEGLPIALLEAMAAGKACVVTDIGLPVENRRDALVVKAGDAEKLRKALEELIENEELRKRLGEEAKKKAMREFSWDRAVEIYLKLFKELTS